MLNENQKETWRWIVNLILTILTAIVTSLGASSCVQQVVQTGQNAGESPQHDVSSSIRCDSIAVDYEAEGE